MPSQTAWLLEQDDDGRDLCSQILAACGLDVLAFKRIDELLRAGGAPRLAVVDAWTADECSELANVLRAERTIVMTTHPFQAAFWAERGFLHILLKPFDFGRFDAIVRSWTSSCSGAGSGDLQGRSGPARAG